MSLTKYEDYWIGDGMTYRFKKECILAIIGQQLGCIGTLVSGEFWGWGMGLTLIGILYIVAAAYGIDA